jgi:hypothetical protein
LSFKKDDTKEANKLFNEKSENIGEKFDNNSTKSEIAASNCKYNILEKNFKIKRNDCKIHDRCVNSLQNTNEFTDSRIKNTEYANVIMNGRYSKCSNQRKVKEIESCFGKLFRIGSLAGDVWKSTTPQKPCTFIHAHSYFTQEKSKKLSIENQISTFFMQTCNSNNISPLCCNNDLILVDTFEDKSCIAKSIAFEIFNSDPKELIYYITCIAEFGFNHIIVIGETYGGLIFLDCYGRVFLWGDEYLLLFPLGNFPEEVLKYSFKKDRLGWFIKNGIIYEYILEFGYKTNINK